MNIDYNRGVHKRIHTSGVEIYMYADTPGVFLNSFGSEVSPQMAEQAGFDVEGLTKARRKRESLAAAASLIEQEFSGVGAEHDVVLERGGFKIISVGKGRHIVEDPDGQNLTPMPMPLEAANTLLEQLVPEVVEVAPDPSAELIAQTPEEVDEQIAGAVAKINEPVTEKAKERPKALGKK